MATDTNNAKVELRMAEGDFDYWWNVPGDWVEPPNERRNGWSGMLRVKGATGTLYVKRQRNHLCRTLTHPLGWPTASREWHYLNRLRELGLRVPAPVFHGVRRGAQGLEAVVVTEELSGYADLSQQLGLSVERLVALTREIGSCLGVLHRAALQHSCLYDKHVMVRWNGDQPEVALIDLEKMRKRLRAPAAAKHDLEQLRRRQSVLDGAAWAVLLQAHALTFAGCAR
jgi:tRNA A-37 threonylcarbamoyl transferase component Bud32